MSYKPGSVMLAGGDVATTTSGRTTAPFPRVDMTTARRSANTISRACAWLLAEARAELDARERPRIEYFTTGVESASVRNWTQADGDMFDAMLFDPAFWRD